MADQPATAEKDQLAADIRDALRAGQKVRLGALRLLSAAVRNREIELGHAVSPEEFTEVVGREAKRRRESIEAYGAAGRDDLVAKEAEELEVLEARLPPPLSDEELEAMIEAAVAETGASSPREMGAVMKRVMSEAGTRADGARVSALVRARLAGGG